MRKTLYEYVKIMNSRQSVKCRYKQEFVKLTKKCCGHAELMHSDVSLHSTTRDLFVKYLKTDIIRELVFKPVNS